MLWHVIAPSQVSTRRWQQTTLEKCLGVISPSASVSNTTPEQPKDADRGTFFSECLP